VNERSALRSKKELFSAAVSDGHDPAHHPRTREYFLQYPDTACNTFFGFGNAALVTLE
jgi:hypothetical protein